MSRERKYTGKTVLVVDDEQVPGELFASAIGDYGFTVEYNDSSLDAITQYWETGRNIGLVVTDIQMPFRNGVELAEAFRIIAKQKAWDTPRIYAHTGLPDISPELRAVQRRGIVDFVSSKRKFPQNFRRFLLELSQ